MCCFALGIVGAATEGSCCETKWSNGAAVDGVTPENPTPIVEWSLRNGVIGGTPKEFILSFQFM